MDYLEKVGIISKSLKEMERAFYDRLTRGDARGGADVSDWEK